MEITTYRIKQYNSTYKTVICANGEPICIVDGCGRNVSNIIAYLNGYNVVISDGKIKSILDRYKIDKEQEDGLSRSTL